MKIKKEKYDYYYDKHGFVIATICYILTENGIVGRGVSVRNKQDSNDETIGKSFAEQYALRAIKSRPLDNFKRKEVVSRLIQCKCPFTKKGERNPELSWWERKFLFGAKNMHGHTAKSGFPQIEFKINMDKPAMAMADAMQRFRRLHFNKSVIGRGFK